MAKKNQKQQENKKKQAVILSVIALVVFLIVLGVAVADAVSSGKDAESTTETAIENTDNGNAKTAEEAASAATDFETTHYADIEVADYGTITVALAGNVAPLTVENFVSLAESGFYDGLTFHRIMEGFMMQGGDPTGTGMGGSEETIKGEFSQNGVENLITHVRGAISMARSNEMDSASSQFFIVHEDSTFLDGAYAAFGYVTEGMEVVDAVCSEAQPTDNNGTIPAEAQPVITSVTIREAE